VIDLTPSSSPTSSYGGSGRFRAFVAAARACYVAPIPPFDLGACAGTDLGSLAGTSFGVTHGVDRAAFLFALAAGAHAGWSLTDAVALTLRADLLAPTIRPDFQVDGASFHKVAPVLGRLGGGVELRF
jgi:hypothetical protein